MLSVQCHHFDQVGKCCSTHMLHSYWYLQPQAHQPLSDQFPVPMPDFERQFSNLWPCVVAKSRGVWGNNGQLDVLLVDHIQIQKLHEQFEKMSIKWVWFAELHKVLFLLPFAACCWWAMDAPRSWISFWHLVIIPLPHENMLGIGFQVVFAIQTCVISVAVNMTQTSIRKTLEEHLKRMLMSIQTYSLTHW